MLTTRAMPVKEARVVWLLTVMRAMETRAAL